MRRRCGFVATELPLAVSMNCPLCDVALKMAGYRGCSVNYCPLCGGTWLERRVFDSLPSNAGAVPRPWRAHGRLLRIAALTALVLTGCLIATISVGAVKLWPTVQMWAVGLFRGNEAVVAAQLRDLAGRLGASRLSALSQTGLSSAAVSVLLGNSGFERFVRSLESVPDLGPFVQSGAYLKVLQ